MTADIESRDWDALADWAEAGGPWKTPAAVELHGEDAARAGRELLRRIGRPPLGGMAEGPSRRVQARLPASVTRDFDAYLEERGVTASQAIRDAVDTLLAQHKKNAA
jgi:hypothetical protein